MKGKEADCIINSYEPYEGFYDLSKKPKSLTKIEYAKVLYAQDILAKSEKNKEYLMKMTPIQYQNVKEISAMYQEIVYQYWGFDTIIGL